MNQKKARNKRAFSLSRIQRDADFGAFEGGLVVPGEEAGLFRAQCIDHT
jgi:hypothetical protein